MKEKSIRRRSRVGKNHPGSENRVCKGPEAEKVKKCSKTEKRLEWLQNYNLEEGGKRHNWKEVSQILVLRGLVDHVKNF